RLRSYVDGADGERYFVSGAFDWRISPSSLLEFDFDYQHKSQVTAAGYQLLGGTTLPTGINPKTNLNAQPWTKPVESDSGNIGLRFEHQFDESWKTSFAANWFKMRRDDYAAFPAGGCGMYPGFCSNGDFDLWDYQSENEAKNIFSTQALIQGKFTTGALSHNLSIGLSTQSRRDQFGEPVFEKVGTVSMYNPAMTVTSGSTKVTGPVGLRRRDLEKSIFIQDIVDLTEQWKLHGGLRYVETERE